MFGVGSGLVGPAAGDRSPRCHFPGFYSARIDSQRENGGVAVLNE